MDNRFSRSRAVLGDKAIEVLSGSRVAVFGLGGVGGYALEALARAGVGALDIIDSDTVDITNINRQLIALSSTVGRKKTELFAQRIADINPDCRVTVHDCFYLPDEADKFDFGAYDYVVDAIDTVTAKIDLAVRCTQLNIPIISSMGTGNKLDPAALYIADIYSTDVCPLARVMRRELKKRGVRALKTVCSKEPPVYISSDSENGSRIPGSVSFVPPVAGMMMAAEAVKDIIGRKL